METNTVSSRVFSLVVLYDMHTTFFASALDGISDEDAHNRLNTKANHICWLTGSLVEERFELVRSISNDPGKVQEKQSANELFKNNQGIQDDVTYPPLSDFKKDWEHITPILRQALINITDEKLDSQFDMEGMTMTYYELITFITYREANCIGQIALWRRLLGYEAMKYM